MSLVGLSVGYFSASDGTGERLPAVCARIREICGPSSQAFPFVQMPVRDADGHIGLSYAVVSGHVPLHIVPPNAADACPTAFTFVLEAENRPVMLFAPAGQQEAQCIYLPEEARLPRMGLGAVEIIPGRAFHFDLCRSFHGITGFPTGDLARALPEAVMVQVPWPRKDDIGGALATMQRIMRADDRLADLLQTGG